MTPPRHLQTDRDFYYDSASDLSPSALRDQDAVPVGTVAARIMELHNLAKVSTFNGAPSPISRHPENSRIGFGRRADSRFGKPASRSCKPDEYTQEDTKHTFLGLNTHRSNHMEAHAFVDGRVKWNRTAGLHQQLQPSGLGETIQHQATTSSDILPKGDFQRDSPLLHGKKATGRIKDSCPQSQSNIIAPKLSLPNLPHCITPQVSIKQEESLKARFQEPRRYQSSDQQKALTTAESQSFGKASTLRRQSLRDLYDNYGIHRPAGLVMSQKVTFGLEDTSRSLSRQALCQACSCNIAVCAMSCTSGVSLCEKCQNSSPATMMTSDGSDESMENKPECEGEHLQNENLIAQLLDTKTLESINCEQPSTLLECPSDQGRLCHLAEDTFQHTEGESNSMIRKLPLLRLEEAEPCRQSLKSLQGDTQLHDSSQVCQQSGSAEVLHSVKDTTSVSIVDTILSTRAPNTVTINTQLSNLDTQSLHHGQRQRQEGHRSRGLCSNSPSRDELGSGNVSRGSSDCPVVDQGCLPYRHSNICGRKRRRYPNETDSGYIAGTSHLEEPEMLQRDIDQNPRSGIGVQFHHMISNQYSSPNQSACASLMGETKFYGDNQSIHQISYAKHTLCSPGTATRAEDVPQAQQQLFPKAERTSTNEAAAWNLDTPHSHDLQEESKDRYDDKTADNSCDCKWWRNEHRIQSYTAGIAHATNGINKENTYSRQDLMPRSTTPILANAESALMRTESPSKSVTSCLMTTIPGTKIYVERKRHMIASHNTANKEISLSKDGSKLGSQEKYSEIIRESFEELPLDPSTNKNGAQATNFDSFTKAAIQDSLEASEPPPSTAAEADQPIRFVNLRTDLNTDVAQSSPIYTSGDLSPAKFKPTSRRLSAFFKLQEQNVVSILNKRLQDHQEALKRAETICDIRVNDRINAAIQSLSLDREQNHELDIEKNISRVESLKGNTAEQHELDLPNLSPQLGEPIAEVDRLRAEGLDGQNPSFKLTHMIDTAQEHNCAWKQLAMTHNSGVAQNPKPRSENENPMTHDKVGDGGINGITIVIHLEGRESVIIKADLSQGI